MFFLIGVLKKKVNGLKKVLTRYQFCVILNVWGKKKGIPMISKEAFLKKVEQEIIHELMTSNEYNALIRKVVFILPFYVCLIVLAVLSPCLFGIIFSISSSSASVKLIAGVVLVGFIIVFIAMTKWLTLSERKIRFLFEKKSEIALSYLGYLQSTKDTLPTDDSCLFYVNEKVLNVFKKDDVWVAFYEYRRNGDDLFSYELCLFYSKQSDYEAVIYNDKDSLSNVKPFFQKDFFENNSVYMKKPENVDLLFRSVLIDKIKKGIALCKMVEKNASNPVVRVDISLNYMLFAVQTNGNFFNLNISKYVLKHSLSLKKWFSISFLNEPVDVRELFENLYNQFEKLEQLIVILKDERYK